jgi:predicted DNA-binding transcriptional regulator AlpA
MTTDLRAALRLVAEAAPAGAFVPVQRELLLDLVAAGHGPALVAPTTGATWRERLWTCPDDARLRVQDVAEALGRPRSYVYRAVAARRGVHRLPASRLSGELVFVAGTVRAWLEREEQGT